jgi:hypothetical protein
MTGSRLTGHILRELKRCKQRYGIAPARLWRSGLRILAESRQRPPSGLGAGRCLHAAAQGATSIAYDAERRSSDERPSREARPR